METAPAAAAADAVQPPPLPPSSPVAQVGDNFQGVDSTAAVSSQAVKLDVDDDHGDESDVESVFGGNTCVKKAGTVGDEEESWSVVYRTHVHGDQCLEEYQRWMKGTGFRHGGMHIRVDQEINKETLVKDTREEEDRAFWEACLASRYPSP